MLSIPEIRLNAINLTKQFRRKYINVKSIMEELSHEFSNCLDSKTHKGIRDLADTRIHNFHYHMFLQYKVELSKHILCYLIKGMYTVIDNSLDSEPESTALLTDSAKKVQPFPPGNILRNLIPLVLSRYNMLSYRVTPHSSSSAGRICLLIYASPHSSALLMHGQWLEFELPWAEGAQF